MRSPTMWRTSLAVIRRCTLVAMIISTSSTPWSASRPSTMVRTRSRTSGRRIGGSGKEMSSMAMTTFMPGRSLAWSGGGIGGGRVPDDRQHGHVGVAVGVGEAGVEIVPVLARVIAHQARLLGPRDHRAQQLAGRVAAVDLETIGDDVGGSDVIGEPR